MPINYVILVCIISQFAVLYAHASNATHPMGTADAPATDIAVKSFSESTLASIYTQTQPGDSHSYFSGLESVQPVFDASLYEKILTEQRDDELMTLAQQNAMVMTQRQNSSRVAMTKSNSNKPTWQVTTQLIVYYVKDQIEIVRPLTNTMMITTDTTSTTGYKITAFSTITAAQPELINYQQLRQKNCPSMTAPTSAS